MTRPLRPGFLKNLFPVDAAVPGASGDKLLLGDGSDILLGDGTSVILLG